MERIRKNKILESDGIAETYYIDDPIVKDALKHQFVFWDGFFFTIYH